MKRAELYQPYESTPFHQEVGVPIEYSIPYSWGDLYVSKTASETYGLVPLITNVKDGYSVQDLSDAPNTRIFILTPGELNTPSSLEHREAFINPCLNRYGLEYRIALGDNKNTAAEFLNGAMRDMLRQAVGEDQEIVMDQFVDENDIPMNERFEQDSSQVLIHELCGAMSKNITDATLAWVRAESNYRFYNRVKIIGALAVVGTGALTVPLILINDFGAVNAGVAGIWLTFQANALRYQLKNKAVTANRQELAFRAISRASGALITSDIHKTYCRAHSNQKLEEQFSPEE